jgi:hypothetical protein
LVEVWAGFYAEKAKANQAHGLTAPGKTLCQISDKAFEPIDVLKEIAEKSGFSRDTVSKNRKMGVGEQWNRKYT